MSTQSIWLDAASFQNYGGWKLDTQFIDKVGQGYLLACDKPGKPVADATSKFNITEPGMYRVWVRCRNWYYPYRPGLFRIAVDQEESPKDLGGLPSHAWLWEIAGDFHLTEGEHSLAVRDLTGYFGRFASILITNDMDLVPPRGLGAITMLRTGCLGEAESSEASYDVVVVGGGPGGVPAAIAAARQGAKVALITNRPILGGNGSDEVGVYWNGAAARHPEAREGGIMEEVLRTVGYKGISWSEAWAELCAAEPNLTIYKNWHVKRAITSNQHITHLEAVHCVQNKTLKVNGKIFIDASGDSVLITSSGAKYRQGREAAWQHEESFAPEIADQNTMSGCVFRAQFTEGDGPSTFDPPEWLTRLPAGSAIGRNIERIGPTWWNEASNLLDNIEDGELARDELFRVLLSYFDYLKNLWDDKEKARNYEFSYMPRLLAKRESRRMVGDYMLTENDCRSGRSFADVIGYSGWPIDLHHPEGIYSGEEGPYDQNAPVPIVQIPYRSVTSGSIDNLFASGRNISVTHVALGTTRLQSTIAQIAQSVGTAAALCLQKGVTPRELGQSAIQELQQQLLRDDLWLPGHKNEDREDLAQTAEVTASSFSISEALPLLPGTPAEWLPLDQWRASFRPKGPESDIPRIYLLLRNASEEPKTISAQVYTQADPDAYLKGEPDAVAEAVLEPGEHWLGFTINLHTEHRYLYVALEENMDVYWRTVHFPGLDWSRSEKRRAEDDFENIRWEAHMVLLEEPIEENANCQPHTVLTGTGRGKDPENYGWVSDPEEPLPQWLSLELPEAIVLSRIELTFDSDFNSPAIPIHVPKLPTKLVKAYTVEIKTDGEWQSLIEVSENYQRYRIHTFDPVEVEQIRINVLETGGDPSARIFGVRLYKD